MKIKFVPAPAPATGPLVLFAAAGPKLSGVGAAMNEQYGRYIAEAMKAGKFEANREQVLDLMLPAEGSVRRIFVAGIGDPGKLQRRDLELAGGAVCGALQGAKITEAALAADFPGVKDIPPGEAAALVASGLRLRQYVFTKYKTAKGEDKPPLKSLTLVTGDPALAQRLYAEFEAVAGGVHLARDFVNQIRLLM